MLFTFSLEFVLLSCETLELTGRVGEGFAELVVDCACNVVVVEVAPGCCVITVDVAAETARVVEIDAIEDLASNFNEFVVDGAALEFCSVAEVKVEDFVVDGAALAEVKFGDFVVDSSVLEVVTVGDFVVDGAALEVCSVVGVMVEDLVVDGPALDAGFVVGVMVEDFVVDGPALEVSSVAEVKSDDFAVACPVLEARVDVTFVYDCDDPDGAISHITVQAELSVCILFGTDAQILRVDPCIIGKPLES